MQGRQGIFTAIQQCVFTFFGGVLDCASLSDLQHDVGIARSPEPEVRVRRLKLECVHAQIVHQQSESLNRGHIYLRRDFGSQVIHIFLFPKAVGQLMIVAVHHQAQRLTAGMQLEKAVRHKQAYKSLLGKTQGIAIGVAGVGMDERVAIHQGKHQNIFAIFRLQALVLGHLQPSCPLHSPTPVKAGMRISLQTRELHIRLRGIGFRLKDRRRLGNCLALLAGKQRQQNKEEEVWAQNLGEKVKKYLRKEFDAVIPK